MKTNWCTRMLAMGAAAGLLLTAPAIGSAQQQPAPPTDAPAQESASAEDAAEQPEAAAAADTKTPEAQSQPPGEAPAPEAPAPEAPAPEAPAPGEAAPQSPDQPSSDRPSPPAPPAAPGADAQNQDGDASQAQPREAATLEAPQQEQAQPQGQAQPEQPARMNLGAEFTMQENRLVVSRLEQNTAFARAGFQQGDIILSAFGRPIGSQADLEQILQSTPPTQSVPIAIFRDGQQQTVYVQGLEQRQYRGEAAGMMQPQPWLGVTLDIRYQDRAVVASVLPGSPAEEAGLTAGDWIMSFNGQQVANTRHLIQMVRSLQPGQEVQMAVGRLETRQLNTALGQRPQSPASAAIQPRQPLTAEGQQRPAPLDRTQMRGYRGEQQIEGRIENRTEAPQQQPRPAEAPQTPAPDQQDSAQQDSAQDQSDQSSDAPQEQTETPAQD